VGVEVGAADRPRRQQRRDAVGFLPRQGRPRRRPVPVLDQVQQRHPLVRHGCRSEPRALPPTAAGDTMASRGETLQPQLQRRRIRRRERMQYCRNTSAAGAGAAALWFVSIDPYPRCCCGGPGRGTCPRSTFAFTVTTWTMSLSA
jgi:hypothetical protein